jgi:anti-sigma factor RsiW
MTCREIEDKLTSYVDGNANGDAAAIAAHLERCDSCRASAHAQAVARTVMRARAAQLAPHAPPGLLTRIVSTPGFEQYSTHTDVIASFVWTRFSAFAAAVVVMLTLGAVLLPMVTVRSTAVLAAQLALDHLKCFTIEGDGDGTPIAKADAEAVLKNEFGLAVAVPASVPEEHLQLMAVRRCLYGDGRAAHVMYRLDGEPVSLFIVPGVTRPASELSLFGHDQIVWTQGDRTYMLVARGGARNGLARVASYLQNEAK